MPDMARVVAPHEIVGHGRNQRTRQDERADQRKDDGFGERPEQISRDAAELEHRHEHDAQAEQGHEGGHHDLLRAVQDRRLDLLALLQMIIDVLDRDRSVVDQDADRQRKAAERHDVDGLAENGQRGQREQNGKGNFSENDDRRAPAAEEHQNHHADQRRGQHGLANNAEHRGLDEDRLIAHRFQVEARGQTFLDPRQQRLDPVDDVERRRRSRLEDGHQHRARTVDPHHIGLRRRALMDVGNVMHVDDEVLDFLHRQLVDLVEHGGTGVEGHVPVEFADLLVAGRQNEVLRGDGVDDVLGRDAVRLHRLLIEIDLHLQDLATIGRGHRRSLDGGKLRPDEVLSEIEQLHLGQRPARQRKLQDRHAGGVVAQDIGRRDAGRQQLQHGLGSRRHLRHGCGNIDLLLEEDLDHAIAAQRLRLDMFDVADLGAQGALIVVDHAARHVVRQQTVIGPDHTDHGNIDIRKDVGRREQRRAYAEQRD